MRTTWPARGICCQGQLPCSSVFGCWAAAITSGMAAWGCFVGICALIQTTFCYIPFHFHKRKDHWKVTWNPQISQKWRFGGWFSSSKGCFFSGSHVNFHFGSMIPELFPFCWGQQVLKWSRLISQGATGAPEEDAADVHQQERERLQLLRVKMSTFHWCWQIFIKQNFLPYLVHVLIILLIHLLHVPFPIKSQMFWPYLIHFTVYIPAVFESFKMLYFFCVVSWSLGL